MHRSTRSLTDKEPEMSDFRAHPTITRSSTSFLMASAFAAVALNMAIVSLEMTTANNAHAWPVAGDAAPAPSAALDVPALAPEAAAGTDHGAIAANAVSADDVDVVEMSIAAYDRVSESALSR
jgi:hypothetical protein